MGAAFDDSATSEDCLNLNVWTPAADGARRPVLVHVFGGGFQTGSAFGGPQDAEALSAQGDIVVVRVNFRIGALGFLHLRRNMGRTVSRQAMSACSISSRRSSGSPRTSRALGGDPDKVTCSAFPPAPS